MSQRTRRIARRDNRAWNAALSEGRQRTDPVGPNRAARRANQRQVKRVVSKAYGKLSRRQDVVLRDARALRARLARMSPERLKWWVAQREEKADAVHQPDAT